MRKKGKGDQIIAREMVLRKFRKIETESAVTVQYQHGAHFSEEPTVSREGKASCRSHQFILEREHDFNAVDHNLCHRVGHAFGEVADVDDHATDP